MQGRFYAQRTLPSSSDRPDFHRYVSAARLPLRSASAASRNRTAVRKRHTSRRWGQGPSLFPARFPDVASIYSIRCWPASPFCFDVRATRSAGRGAGRFRRTAIDQRKRSRYASSIAGQRRVGRDCDGWHPRPGKRCTSSQHSESRKPHRSRPFCGTRKPQPPIHCSAPNHRRPRSFLT